MGIDILEKKLSEKQTNIVANSNKSEKFSIKDNSAPMIFHHATTPVTSNAKADNIKSNEMAETKSNSTKFTNKNS